MLTALNKLNRSKTARNSDATYTNYDFGIGLGLAILSSLFIGSSFIIKKKGLIRLSRYGETRASAGGHGYLKDWLWWAGFLTMGVGEAANFAAYAYAPASLVTPLGALSVIVAAIMSSKFLKEKLNLLGKLGCLLCILGSTIIVLHSPKGPKIHDAEVILARLQDPGFFVYLLFIFAVCLLIVLYLGPKYGHQNVTIYIVLCSAVGSLTVMSCKTLGVVVRETMSGTVNRFTSWFPWMLILATAIFIVVQMNYLNKALDSFNTSIVTPIYYVIFSTLVMVASAVLFKEWVNMKAEDVAGDVCGFLTIITAIFLLNAFKEMDISLNDIKSTTWSKFARKNPEGTALLHSNREDRHKGEIDALARLL